ncbi:MAG: hypothetical protein KDA96_04195 [Planctomycetaceae bacterium]|nr:hypothetical protein [Planctomycetaceae bacterium]
MLDTAHRVGRKRLAAILCFVSLCATSRSPLADDLQAERDQQFSERMANTVMIGSFTIDGKEDGQTPRTERYEIRSVTRATDNLWVFTARVKYGKVDVTVPITVPLEWAGDTPMVSLTDASLPGLGEGFSARVLFYQDRYAGTWQHGKVGGHMFGRIEKAAPVSEEKPGN